MCLPSLLLILSLSTFSLHTTRCMTWNPSWNWKVRGNQIFVFHQVLTVSSFRSLNKLSSSMLIIPYVRHKQKQSLKIASQSYAMQWLSKIIDIDRSIYFSTLCNAMIIENYRYRSKHIGSGGRGGRGRGVEYRRLSISIETYWEWEEGRKG